MFGEFAAFLANIDVKNNKMTNQEIFEILTSNILHPVPHLAWLPQDPCSHSCSFLVPNRGGRARLHCDGASIHILFGALVGGRAGGGK